MNLRYEIKRLQGFGYATTLSDCKMRQITRNEDKKIVYIKDSKNESRIKNADNIGTEDSPFMDYYEKIMSLDVHDKIFDTETIFMIEVGVKDKEIVRKDVEVDQKDLENIIDKFEIHADISDENKKTYKDFTKNLITNPKNYSNLECTETYLDFLSQLYLKIKDSKLQRTILQLLIYNQRRCDEILHENPINFRPIEEEITRISSTFSDMQISDPYFEKTEEFSAEQVNGVSRNLTVGNLAKFGSFSNKFTQVEHAKKRANIPDINALRNHENIHILARGRIASVPNSFQELTISKLFKMMSRFKKFHVILIYPNYQQPFNYAEYPSRSMEIDPENGNVVLCVFLRYILIYFYGMHSIVNQDDKYSRYLM